METKDSGKSPWWQPSVILFARMSGWIAGPIIIAIFIGKYLDKKYNTDPWLFLLSVGLAFVLSMTGIVRDAMQAMKDIEKQESRDKRQEKRDKKN